MNWWNQIAESREPDLLIGDPKNPLFRTNKEAIAHRALRNIKKPKVRFGRAPTHPDIGNVF